MPTTYSDLIADIRKSIAVIPLEEIKRRLDTKTPMVLVDVREKEEFRDGVKDLTGNLKDHAAKVSAETKAEARNGRSRD